MHTGQPLIPKLHRKTRLLSDRFGELPYPARLAAFAAAHIDRIPEQNQTDLALPHQRLKRRKVAAYPGAHQVWQSLRGNAERIANCEANAFFAEVKRQNAGFVDVQVNFIIDAGVVDSSQGLFRFVALVPKPVTAAQAVVQEVRHVALPIIAFGVLIAILHYGRVFFITSIVALTIAFILEPFVGLLMRIRFPRSVASFVVCTLALLFLYVIGMAAYTQLSGIASELPKYSQRIGELVESVTRRIEDMEEQTYRIVVPARQRQVELERLRAQQAAEQSKRKRKAQELPPQPVPGAITEVRIHEERTPVGEYVYARLGSLYQILLMASFVPFLVYFMLSWRDHVNRSFLQFFHGEDRLVAARSLHGIADMVRAFVVGNFLLGLLLAFVSSTLFWLIHLPYPLLVGPLSGFLSLVPYVGLPLALFPPCSRR